MIEPAGACEDRLRPPITADEIADARRRIAGRTIRTPLIPSPGGPWLKLECLQPTGSYKIRGATNALRARAESDPGLRRIVSASTGNLDRAHWPRVFGDFSKPSP